LSNLAKLELGNNIISGTIPAEIGRLSNLTRLDLGGNEVIGTIPEDLYDIPNLQYLYLENNHIEGTLSENLANSRELIAIYLGGNQMTGSIPVGLKSGSSIRPLRYFSIFNNSFTGSIPLSLRLRNLYYLDLSYNQLTGNFEEDFARTHTQIRHFYINHNKFSGTLPETIGNMGNYRTIEFWINDNQFEGTPPMSFLKDNKENKDLLTYKIQNNNWDKNAKINNKDFCNLWVFSGESGEIVEFGTTCDYCPCKDACDRCDQY